MFSKLAVDTFDTSFSYDKENDLVSVKADNEFKDSLQIFSNELFENKNLIQHFPFSNVCIAGGCLNLLLDKNIPKQMEIEARKRSDIDIYIYGTSDPRKVVEGLMMHIYKKTVGSDLYVGYKGSVIYLWTKRIGRLVQLCIWEVNIKQ